MESDVRDRKRHLIQKTITTYGVNALKIADRNNTGVIASPFLLYHIVELGYVRNEQPIMEHGSGNERTLEGLNLFSITDKGRAVLREWLSD